MNPNVKILIEALQNIQSYDHNGDGICTYGCDTPYIAKVALVDFDNAEYTPQQAVDAEVNIGPCRDCPSWRALAYCPRCGRKQHTT